MTGVPSSARERLDKAAAEHGHVGADRPPHDVVVRGRFVRMAAVRDDWYHDVESPESLRQELAQRGIRADLVHFVHRIPERGPRHSCFWEWDNVAAITIDSFDQWWTGQVPKSTRKHIRRAHKRGVEIRNTPFNDAFVDGVWAIYNECPVRQGKPFKNYGNDRRTIRRGAGTMLERSDFLGAYVDDTLIGFIKLVYAGKTARTMEIISMLAHRDKWPTNALIAEAVRTCAEKGARYLVYGTYEYAKVGSQGLTSFKSENGFEKIDVRRYYVPLTCRGRVFLALRLHKGLAHWLPRPLIRLVLGLRKLWFEHRRRSK